MQEMMTKFGRNRQILTSNWEQAESEVRRLDDIYHDTVDQLVHGPVPGRGRLPPPDLGPPKPRRAGRHIPCGAGVQQYRSGEQLRHVEAILIHLYPGRRCSWQSNFNCQKYQKLEM